MDRFDWHKDPIGRDTPVDARYRSTQNVRRFLTAQCAGAITLPRPFMAWIRNGQPKTMGDVADEWTRRYGARQDAPGQALKSRRGQNPTS